MEVGEESSRRGLGRGPKERAGSGEDWGRLVSKVPLTYSRNGLNNISPPRPDVKVAKGERVR